MKATHYFSNFKWQQIKRVKIYEVQPRKKIEMISVFPTKDLQSKNGHTANGENCSCHTANREAESARRTGGGLDCRDRGCSSARATWARIGGNGCRSGDQCTNLAQGRQSRTIGHEQHKKRFKSKETYTVGTVVVVVPVPVPVLVPDEEVGPIENEDVCA